MTDYWLNRCKECKSNDISIVMGDDQYLIGRCNNCGAEGAEAYYFKDCGMDDIPQEVIAAEQWNKDNEGMCDKYAVITQDIYDDWEVRFVEYSGSDPRNDIVKILFYGDVSANPLSFCKDHKDDDRYWCKQIYIIPVDQLIYCDTLSILDRHNEAHERAEYERLKEIYG